MGGKVRNSYGEELYFDVVKYFMDDDIREELHRNMAPCTNQEFFDAYAKAHKEKFGTTWMCDDFTFTEY